VQTPRTLRVVRKDSKPSPDHRSQRAATLQAPTESWGKRKTKVIPFAHSARHHFSTILQISSVIYDFVIGAQPCNAWLPWR
jgi:hypothetical protein